MNEAQQTKAENPFGAFFILLVIVAIVVAFTFSEGGRNSEHHEPPDEENYFEKVGILGTWEGRLPETMSEMEGGIYSMELEHASSGGVYVLILINPNGQTVGERVVEKLPANIWGSGFPRTFVTAQCIFYHRDKYGEDYYYVVTFDAKLELWHKGTGHNVFTWQPIFKKK